MNLPRPSSTVVYRDLPEGAILFCTRTEVYFSLNPLGAEIWRSLPPVCANEEEIIARIAGQYPDVDPERIAADVQKLIAEFVGNGLADLSLAA